MVCKRFKVLCDSREVELVASTGEATETHALAGAAGGRRIFQSLISLMDAIVAICADHRPINATHDAGRGDRRSTRLHRKGVSNVRCGAIPSQSSRIQGIPDQHTVVAERND